VTVLALLEVAPAAGRLLVPQALRQPGQRLGLGLRQGSVVLSLRKEQDATARDATAIDDPAPALKEYVQRLSSRTRIRWRVKRRPYRVSRSMQEVAAGQDSMGPWRAVLIDTLGLGLQRKIVCVDGRRRTSYRVRLSVPHSGKYGRR